MRKFDLQPQEYLYGPYIIYKIMGSWAFRKNGASASWNGVYYKTVEDAAAIIDKYEEELEHKNAKEQEGYFARSGQYGRQCDMDEAQAVAEKLAGRMGATFQPVFSAPPPYEGEQIHNYMSRMFAEIERYINERMH